MMRAAYAEGAPIRMTGDQRRHGPSPDPRRDDDPDTELEPEELDDEDDDVGPGRRKPPPKRDGSEHDRGA